MSNKADEQKSQLVQRKKPQQDQQQKEQARAPDSPSPQQQQQQQGQQVEAQAATDGQPPAPQGPLFRKPTGFYGVDVPYRVAWNGACMAVWFWVAYWLWRYGHIARDWLAQGLGRVAPGYPEPAPGLLTGVLLAGAGFYFFCYAFTLLATLHTSIIQRPAISRQMVNTVTEWGPVRAVLDLGCGRGVLLATIALRLEGEGKGGKVVGYDHWPAHGDAGRFDAGSMAFTLKNCAREGVGTIVTCKSGDLARLPFADQYFDHVMSALSLQAATEGLGDRWKDVLREAARVIKPGGKLIIWDIKRVKTYAAFLEAEGKWADIQVIPGVTAFMLKSKYLIASRKA